MEDVVMKRIKYTITLILIAAVLFLPGLHDRGSENDIAQVFLNESADGENAEKSVLEQAVRLPHSVLTTVEMRQLVGELAADIGIKNEAELEVVEEEGKYSVTLRKNAKRARTAIKLISINEDNYIFFRLELTDDNNREILDYREQLRDLAEELGAYEISCSIEISRAGDVYSYVYGRE